MAGSEQPLRLYEVGQYGELSSRPNPAGYVVLTVPDFDTLVYLIERDQGHKLTPAEIEAKRKETPAIVLPKEEADMMLASRTWTVEPTSKEPSIKTTLQGH